MTLVSLPSPIAWPGNCGNVSTAPNSFTTATLDASGKYVSFIFSAKEDMTISHIGFRAGTVANSPTVEVRVETVDTSTGLPTGTLWATNTNATSATITSNSNPLTALTASASITKGQVACIKLVWGGVATSTVIIQHAVGLGLLAVPPSLPYAVLNTGTPTRTALGSNIYSIALGSSSTTFYNVPGLIPFSAISNSTFNNTNAAKRGLRFTPPMKCRVIGLRWFGSNQTGDYNIAIYDDTTGSAVEVGSSSTAFSGQHNVNSSSAVMSAYFDNAVTLTAGTTYRAAVEPSSATNVNISTFTLVSANYRGASPSGTTAHYTTFVTGGWTDTATDQVPLMDVLIDQFDDGAGTGGVVGVIGG
jgi:hypothetical protein